MANINDTYFEGFYKEIWRHIIPPEMTVKETDFMIDHFHLGPGSKVLDLMCGYGRHAIALGERGINVTAVDNLQDYTTELSAVAADRALPINVINADVANFRSSENFDLAICMGNSLNFFDEAGTRKILSHLNSSLKPGGHVLIHSWSITEIVILNFKEKSWGYVEKLKVLTDSRFLFHPTRIEAETIIIDGEGNSDRRIAIDYIFSVADYERLMNECNIELKECYSIPGRKKFTLGDSRIYFVGGV